MTTKCGYIALIGQVNAGKSTLLNACIGQKISGVSAKPNTTRNEILGIAQEDSCQMLFVDTPGLFDKLKKQFTKHQLGEKIAEIPFKSASEVDVTCYLIDVQKGLDETDEKMILALAKNGKTIFLVACKCDTMRKFELSPQMIQIEQKAKMLEEMAGSKIFVSTTPFAVSAKVKEEVAEFKNTLRSFLPEGPFLFDTDSLTDKPLKFVLAELIREQVFRKLSQEIPFTTTVHVTSYQVQGDKALCSADLVVNKASHKPILIGKGGSAIKNIGIGARHSLENFLGHKVRLDLHVQVQENWVDNPRLLQNYQMLE